MLTAEERILLHLLAHVRHGERYEVPFDLTQSGIALAVGVRRSHVSATVAEMARRGLSEERVAHIEAGGRRRKVYVLTPRGAQAAEALRQRVASQRVSVRFGDTEREMSLGEAVALASRRTLVELALSVRGGVLDLAAASRPPTFREEGRRFYGREAELARFGAFLSSDAVALAVKGLPGIGKTAYLVRAASQAEPAIVCWSRLTEWTTPESLLTALAGRLREAGHPGMAELREGGPGVEAAIARLGSEAAEVRVLLIVDDVHKASDGMVNLLRSLLPVLRGSKGKVVAAGRRIPSFYSRREVLLDGLVREIELGGLDEESARSLLREREVPEDRVPTVLAATKGHPLFLQLVAASGGDGGGDVRQYLREEVLARLDARDQELCAALSVHRHAVTPEAVVTEVTDASRLDGLAERCLLRLGGGLVDMHDLFREFFLTRLTPAQRLRLHAAAAAYYESRPDPASRIEMLYHLVRGGRQGQAAALLGGIGHGLTVRGYQEEVLHVIGLLDLESLDPVERLPVLFLRGEILSTRGDWARAEASFAEAAAVAEDLRDRRGRARAALETGVLEYRRGNFDEARSRFRESMGLLGDLDDALLGRLLNAFGVLEWQAGNLDAASGLYRQSREAYERCGDSAGVAGAINNLGILAWQRGEIDTGLGLYGEALRLSEDLGDERTVAILYNNIGEAYRRKGDSASAEKFYRRSLELAQKLQFLWQMGEVHRNLGRLLGPKEAAVHLQEALEIFQRLGARPDVDEVSALLRERGHP